MELQPLKFSKSWEDPADYPTYESSETQVRADLQSLYTEIQTYINTVLVPAIECAGAEIQGGTVVIPGDVLRKSGGTMVGPLYLAREPVEKTEAATRRYVDNAVGLCQSSAEEGIAALTIRAGKVESTVLDTQGNLSQLTQQAGKLESLMQSAQGDISQIRQTVGEITLSVTEQVAGDGTVSAKITLTIGPNSYSGVIRMTGNVEVSGQLSAQALYAARGDIARLTVDSLSTSRRIIKYLAGDTGDDNFLRMQEQTLDFVSGVCIGGRTQAVTSDGDRLYWEDAVYHESDVVIGSDGYPYRSGSRIFTTTTVTAWPVYVYQYQELVKQSFCFALDEQTGDYAPVAVFGAGDLNGTNKGYLLKRRTGLDLRYQPPNSGEIGVHMGADGYLDLTGLRRTAALNLSQFSEGVFTETLEGGEVVTYHVEFDTVDGQRVPVAITDEAGYRLGLTWKEGAS